MSGPRWLSTTAIVVALSVSGMGSGCTAGPPPQSLAQTCQIRSCECVADNASWFGRAATTDIAWETDGDATCPEGYALRLSERDKK